jgi:cell division protein ZapA
MADVRLNIASREYIVTCRDGEEEHLQSLGALVDDMVREAVGSAGGLNESRQLLFASLLLADKLHETQSNPAAAAQNLSSGGNNIADLAIDQAAATIEKLASRLEAFANKLEN